MDGLSSNPFATRFTAPGRVDWVGQSGFFLGLCERWQASDHRAAILGAHGTGKSTLLEHFVPMVAAVVWRRDALGCEVECPIQATVSSCSNSADVFPRRAYWLQLRKCERRSMGVPWDKLSDDCVLVLDGYEQLSFWRRAFVLWRTKQRGIGLLVTSHRKTMLAPLCELSVSVGTARAVIERLTAKFEQGFSVNDVALQQRLARSGGNLRDVLMDFYDEIEQGKLRGE